MPEGSGGNDYGQDASGLKSRQEVNIWNLKSIP